jgi:hypothetical protein
VSTEGPRYRVRLVRERGGEPEWSDVVGDDDAVMTLDKFIFYGWYSLDFIQDGKIVTAVRPGTDSTPVIMGVISGGEE